MKKLLVILFFFIVTAPLKQSTDSYRQAPNKAMSKSRSIASKPVPAVSKSLPKTAAAPDIPYQKEDDRTPHWKKAYTKRFYRMLGEKASQIKDFKIESKKSDIKRKGKLLEHIKISYIREDGNPFTFEALIDQKSGSMIQSWNKTRYEFKKPHVLNPQGKLYKE